MAANMKILLGPDAFMVVAPDGSESDVCEYGLLAVARDKMGQLWGACPEGEGDTEVQGYKIAMTPFITECGYDFDEPEDGEGEPEEGEEGEEVEEEEEGEEEPEEGEEGEEGEPEEGEEGEEEDDAA